MRTRFSLCAGGAPALSLVDHLAEDRLPELLVRPQYWHGGRINIRYVGEAGYPVYAESVAGYREFMRLVRNTSTS